MIFKVPSNPHHSMICQHVMLAVLECFAGWCWFHLKFYPLVMHEKCSCTKGIETRSLFQSWFFSHLKCCAPQVWLCESEGLLVYMNFLFPSTQKWKEKKSHYSMAKSQEISIIWTKNVPELCHCSGRAWRSFARFPRPLLCFSNTASGGHT